MKSRLKPFGSGLVVASLIALTAAGPGSNRETSGAMAPPVTIRGLYPSFDPAVHRYVSRCGRHAPPIRAEVSAAGAEVQVAGSPPRAGAIRIDPGVPPGQDFAVEVIEPGRRDTYRVRCLPADFPKWRFESLRETAPGLFVVSFRASRDARPWVIVFDQEGVPRWWYRPETRVLWAQMLSDGSMAWARSFGDGYGMDPRMAHEIRSLSGDLIRVVRTRGSVTDGHEFRELPNGNFLLDTYAPAGGVELRHVAAYKKRRPPDRAAVAFAEIQEIDPQGRVAWRWNSRARIKLGETGRWWRSVLVNAKQSRFGETFDPVHINAIEPRGPDEVVISTRHTDAVYGIERSSGRIVWKLGGTETPQSLRIVGDPAENVFGGQHDARIGLDGRLTIYDNGKGRPRRPRVVFYRLAPDEGEARYLGQLNDPQVRSSHCCGSARPLEGGGWLVSWGDNPLVTAFDEQGRIAFRLELAASSFRAIPVPAGAVTTPAELDRGLEMMEPEAASASVGSRERGLHARSAMTAR